MVKKELEDIEKRPDSSINTADPEIPELISFDKAIVGKFYRPIKKPINLRIDADILAWLKSKGGRYQTRINSILRQKMQTDIQQKSIK